MRWFERVLALACACTGGIACGVSSDHRDAGEATSCDDGGTHDDAAPDAGGDADAGASCALSSTPVVLASGQAAPTDLLLKNGALYWPNSAEDAPALGTIMRMPPCAGAEPPLPEIIAADLTSPTAITTDDTHIYWITDGTPANRYADSLLQKTRLDGKSVPRTLATPFGRASGLAVANASVFIGAQGVGPAEVGSQAYTDGGLFSCSIDGCAAPTRLVGPTPPATLYRAFGVASDGARVYWTVMGSLGSNYDDGTIYSCAIDACASTIAVVLTGQRVSTALLLRDSTLYWTTEGWPPPAFGGTVMKCTLPNCAATQQALATGLGAAHRLAVDDTHVYFTQIAGTTASGLSLSRVPRGGGALEVLYQSPSGVYGVALDQLNVYFATYGTGATNGAIMGMRK